MEELNKCTTDAYLWVDIGLSSQAGYFFDDRFLFLKYR